VNSLAILLIGFSVFSAITLAAMSFGAGSAVRAYRLGKYFSADA